MRVVYVKKKRRIRRRLRAARRAAVIFAAILIAAAIICKIMAAEEPVEEIQQETEAGELPHKATEPERVQQEPIQETQSGSGNSRNEYFWPALQWLKQRVRA